MLPIAEVAKSQDFFGRLDDYPHTYEFEVKESLPFKAQVFAQDSLEQKNDIGLIIVKAERRGVSEIGRTDAKTATWESKRSMFYAERFKDGGKLEGTLEPGWYKLEVSAPNNDGVYRLVWGTQRVKHGFFGSVRAVFEVKAFLGHSRLGALLSPVLFVPILLIAALVGFFFYKKRKRTLA